MTAPCDNPKAGRGRMHAFACGRRKLPVRDDSAARTSGLGRAGEQEHPAIRGQKGLIGSSRERVRKQSSQSRIVPGPDAGIFTKGHLE